MSNRVDLIKLAEQLQAQAWAPEALAKKHRVKKRTMQTLLGRLHADRKVHVEAWSGARMTTKHYRWGRAPDAPRPAARSAAERMRDSRQKRKAALAQRCANAQ